MEYERNENGKLGDEGIRSTGHQCHGCHGMNHEQGTRSTGSVGSVTDISGNIQCLDPLNPLNPFDLLANVRNVHSSLSQQCGHLTPLGKPAPTQVNGKGPQTEDNRVHAPIPGRGGAQTPC